MNLRIKASTGCTGFSLVELLVVVAIIVILLALLFPNAARVKDRAAILKCANNQKQLGMGIQQYLTDNDGQYPDKWHGTMYSWYGTSGTRGGRYTSLGAPDRPLNKYIGGPYNNHKSDVPIAQCPKDKGTWGNAVDTHYEWNGSSYGSNTSFRGNNDYDPNYPFGVARPTSGSPGRQFSQIVNPGNFVTLSEVGPFMAVWWSRGRWDADPLAENVFWHDPWQWNAVFADGHVKYITVRNEEWRGYDYSFDYRF